MTDNTVRYDICDREDEPFMESCEDGDWVNFADYARLKARVAAADALFDKVSGKYVDYTLVEALAAYQATKEQGK